MTESDDRKGTQSIERATTLLREIASRPKAGWQLADLAARSNLGRSTAHRMLACLVRQRMVTQRSSDRHYLARADVVRVGIGASGIWRSSARCAQPPRRIGEAPGVFGVHALPQRR